MIIHNIQGFIVAVDRYQHGHSVIGLRLLHCDQWTIHVLRADSCPPQHKNHQTLLISWLICVQCTIINHAPPPCIIVHFSNKIKIYVGKKRLAQYAVGSVPWLCGRGNDRGRLSDTNKTVTGLRYPICQCEVRGERWWVGPLWVNYPWTSGKTHCLNGMTSICECLWMPRVCVCVYSFQHSGISSVRRKSFFSSSASEFYSKSIHSTSAFVWLQEVWAFVFQSKTVINLGNRSQQCIAFLLCALSMKTESRHCCCQFWHLLWMKPETNPWRKEHAEIIS